MSRDGKVLRVASNSPRSRRRPRNSAASRRARSSRAPRTPRAPCSRVPRKPARPTSRVSRPLARTPTTPRRQRPDASFEGFRQLLLEDDGPLSTERAVFVPHVSANGNGAPRLFSASRTPQGSRPCRPSSGGPAEVLDTMRPVPTLGLAALLAVAAGSLAPAQAQYYDDGYDAPPPRARAYRDWGGPPPRRAVGLN